ncbi:hypothetical protein SUDANB176_00769 [Streptomyces sp. enrichment culture]
MTRRDADAGHPVAPGVLRPDTAARPSAPGAAVRPRGRPRADAHAAAAAVPARPAAYGTPSSNRTYPAYDPEARAAVPSTAASEGHFRRRMARASGTNSGKRGSR